MYPAFRSPTHRVVAGWGICTETEHLGEPTVSIGSSDEVSYMVQHFATTPERARKLATMLQDAADAAESFESRSRWIVVTGKMGATECDRYLYSNALLVRSRDLDGGSRAHLIAVEGANDDSAAACAAYQAGRLQSQGMVGVRIRDTRAEALAVWDEVTGS